MRAPNSLNLLTQVIATKNATFMDWWEREHVAKGSNSGLVSADRKRLRSH